MLELDLSIFDNYPIEFKEVNLEDFQEPFVVEDKIVIEPNTDGYINDILQANLTIDEKNTVVINAAVGQGKSYGIIQTVKRYYDKIQRGEGKYLIFVASPFVSLVKQYCEDLHKDADIPEEEIFNYGELGRDLNAEYLGKAVQVVTANTLLGNHGTDSFKSSEVKQKYIYELLTYCRENEVKVVFVFDEIHDAYQNFEQKFVFNLWKWKDVLLKNYIISATFNEASKIVIEYLAELTDFKIKIIESKRVRFPEKQSELHLHYASSHFFNEETPEILKVIKGVVAQGKNIDILCYSKTLAKGLLSKNTEIGKLLHDTFDEVKNCTSENVVNNRMENEEPKNQFDNSCCNIGTNFKTGVSIKKENHAFIIITPPRSTKLPFKNVYGIFSGGINNVIQALARQRKKGEIHIILSKPEQFDYRSLVDTQMSIEQKKIFQDNYKALSYSVEPKTRTSFFSLKKQREIVKEFYESKMLKNVENEIKHINHLDRDESLALLNFPVLKEFILHTGERFLAETYPIFGDDLSGYITYASISNQFVNCRLKTVSYKEVLYFENKKIRKGLVDFYMSNLGEDHYNDVVQYVSFNYFLTELRDYLFENFTILIKYVSLVLEEGLKYKKVNYYENKDFEKQFLGFCIELYYGLDHLPDASEKFTDGEIPRSFYLYNKSISAIGADESNISKDEIKFYTILCSFISKISNEIKNYESGNTSYTYLLTTLPNDFFTQEEISEYHEMMVLLNSESFLKSNIYAFKDRLNKATLEKSLDSFYKLIISDFFDFRTSRLPVGNRESIRKNPELKSVVEQDKIIDFYSTSYREDVSMAHYELIGGVLTLKEEEEENLDE